MNKDKIEDVIIALGGIYQSIQNKMMMLSLQQLLKGIKSPNDWEVLQYSALQRFRERLFNQSKIYLKVLNSAWKKALILSYASSVNEEIKIDKEAKEFKTQIPAIIEEKMRAIERTNATQLAVLNSQIMDIHQRSIGNVSFRITADSKEILNSVNIAPLRRSEDVFNSIKKVTETYGVENAPKVNYKTKTFVSRQVSWKSYAEMNARTTLNQESGDYQLSSGGELGIVFYVCSQHADCANDHIDYQGKVYYDERYISFGFNEETLKKIESYISSNNLMSIQSVRDNDPYLTTRPNCRHYFEPVPMDDLLSGSTTPKKILNELDMNKGEGDSELYKELQEQRYNERMIRKWKEKRDKQEMLVNASPTQLKGQEQEELAYLKSKVSEWQAKQRKLVNSSSYLERDYSRESYKTVVEDLGYKASLK